MARSDEGWHWLVTVAVVSACVTLIGSMISRCMFYVQQCLFISFAQIWDVSEHHLHQVTNISTIARLIGEAGMHSFQFAWNHDANAGTNDSVEFGYFRIPAMSFTIRFLSFIRWFHYIYVAADASQVLSLIHI